MEKKLTPGHDYISISTGQIVRLIELADKGNTACYRYFKPDGKLQHSEHETLAHQFAVEFREYQEG